MQSKVIFALSIYRFSPEMSSSTGDEEESDHWFNVMRTFLYYDEFVAYDLNRRQQHINRLPAKYADRLPDVTFEKFGAIQHAAASNQDFFADMVSFHASNSFVNADDEVRMPTKAGPPIDLSQQHRNIAVLHSLYREWSAEGAKERDTTFKVLVDELKLRLPVDESIAYKYKVLVPGCGLGRLPLEIAAAGYCCQGNEFSAFMAIASNFVLNGIAEKNAYRVYPWISNVCNVVRPEDSMQGISVPDTAAADLLNSFRPSKKAASASVAAVETAQVALTSSSTGSHNTDNDNTGIKVGLDGFPEGQYPKFSMAAGDFVEVYTNIKSTKFRDQGGDPRMDSGAEQWDAVVTCFFVDTAPVVLEYVEAIERMLKPGGVWINLGPLLYHWAAGADVHIDAAEDPRYAQSVELSYEELRHVVEGYGFEYLQETWHECPYTRCASSMMWTTYRAVQFTVRKPVVTCIPCEKAPESAPSDPAAVQQQPASL